MTLAEPNVVQPMPATSSRTAILRPIVVREAGAPLSMLRRLGSVETAQLLSQLAKLQIQLEAEAERIADALYVAIPQIIDRQTRQKAIVLRRDLHNSRWERSLTNCRNLFSTMQPRLDLSELERALQQWSMVRTSACEKFASETKQAGLLIHRQLLSSPLECALVLASPEFYAALLRGSAASRLEHIDDSLTRSATAYFFRSVVKTSPFSWLTTVSLADIDNAISQPHQVGGSSVISPARPLANLLLDAWVQHSEDAAARWQYRGPMDAISLEGRGLAVIAEHSVWNRNAIRSNVLVESSELDGVEVEYASADPLTFEEISRRAGEGWPGVRQMLRLGVVHAIPPWRLESSSEFSELADAADNAAAVLPEAYVHGTRKLSDAHSVLRSGASGRARAAALARAQEGLSEALDSTGYSYPSWALDIPLFHELVASAGSERRLPSQTATLLDRATCALIDTTVMHPLYGAMREFLRGTWGAGVEVNLLRFCLEFLRVADSSEVSLAPPVLPPTRPTEHAGLATLARIDYSIFFQLDGEPSLETDESELKLIVNLVHAGALGQFARWSQLPSLRASINESLRRHLDWKHPETRVLAITGGADWSDLQKTSLGDLELVRCPGDLPNYEVTVGPEELLIRLDESSETLQITDQSGTPCAFAYLGTVPKHLLNGSEQLMVLLSDPWIALPQGTNAGTESASPARKLPRIEDRGIVWARERWIVRREELPQRRKGEEPFETYARAWRWWQEMGLPPECFVSSSTGTAPFGRRTKPEWIARDNAHSIIGFLQGAKSGNRDLYEFVEALPSTASQRWTNANGEAIASEFVAIVGSAQRGAS